MSLTGKIFMSIREKSSVNPVLTILLRVCKPPRIRRQFSIFASILRRRSNRTSGRSRARLMALRASLLASIGTTAIFLTDSPGWSAAVSTVSTLHGGKPDAPAAHRRRVIGDHVPAEVFGAAVSTPSTLCASISEARRPSSPCPGEPTASDERGNDSAVEEAPTPARGSLWLSKRACSTSGGAGNSLETKRRVQLCELRGGSTVAQGDDEPTEGMEEAHSMRVLVATTRISSYVDAVSSKRSPDVQCLSCLRGWVQTVPQASRTRVHR